MKRNMDFLAEALVGLRPDKPMYYNSGEPIKASEIVYESECEPISQNELDAKLAELQAAEPMRLLREKRNRLLSESDWTGASDTALTTEQQSAWRLYRQKLRDLPKGLNTKFKVKNVKWPEKP